MKRVTHVTIIGGGPGGYEAALVASRLGAEVTLIERDGVGGSTVLTDCVPSKTLIATSDLLTDVSGAAELGIEVPKAVRADLAAVDKRVLALALAQSADIAERLVASGVKVISGTATIESAQVVVVDGTQRIETDAILLATGAHPRVSPDAQPDGERILTWEQVYALAGAARAHDRRRLGRHGRRVRQRLQRPRCHRHPRLEPRPGPARARTPTPPP